MTPHERGIHEADCDVWNLPRPDAAEPLHPETGRDPATDRYLAQIAPAYERLCRVLAQLSGIFLLALTRDGQGPGLHLDHAMYSVACDQLGEAREIVASTPAPEPARRHRAGLVDLADRLDEAARGMDRVAARTAGAPSDADRRDVLKCLAAAQRLLIACAEPEAGITPVDFAHACCNCRTAPVAT